MGVMDKFKDMWRQPADDETEYDDYYDNQNEGYYEASNDEQKQREQPQVAAPAGKPSGRVVNIHQAPTCKVCVFRPERFGEETKDIANELIQMNIVLLNLENTNKDMSRRIIDFLTGVTYANDGKIRRIATNTFMLAPNNVDINSDDIMDELESNGIYI